MTRPTGSHDASTGDAVTGVFEDRASVVRAVEALAEQSVPSDSIRVFMEDSEGGRREVPVDDESGTLRGALVGAAVGAFAGLLIALAAAAGFLGPVGVDVVSFRGFAGAVRAILGGAAAAVPLGALLGMGYWQGRKRLSKSDFRGARAVVEVESRELADRAREILVDSGAVEVR